MGKCIECFQILPPDCMMDVGIGQKCVFCHTGKNYKMVADDITGNIVEMTKEFAQKDYMNFLAKIANSGDVGKTLKDIMNKKDN